MFKEYRERLNLTQKELSKISGVSTNTISRIENSYVTPTMETGAKLIKALKISDEDILNYINDYAKLARRLYHV